MAGEQGALEPDLAQLARRPVKTASSGIVACFVTKWPDEVGNKRSNHHIRDWGLLRLVPLQFVVTLQFMSLFSSDLGMED